MTMEEKNQTTAETIWTDLLEVYSEDSALILWCAGRA